MLITVTAHCTFLPLLVWVYFITFHAIIFESQTVWVWSGRSAGTKTEFDMK